VLSSLPAVVEQADPDPEGDHRRHHDGHPETRIGTVHNSPAAEYAGRFAVVHDPGATRRIALSG
jgi:hypothetical protein